MTTTTTHLLLQLLQQQLLHHTHTYGSHKPIFRSRDRPLRTSLLLWSPFTNLPQLKSVRLDVFDSFQQSASSPKEELASTAPRAERFPPRTSATVTVSKLTQRGARPKKDICLICWRPKASSHKSGTLDWDQDPCGGKIRSIEPPPPPYPPLSRILSQALS